jgi:hypothetical protein
MASDLFNTKKDWEKEWVGMPEFVQEYARSFSSLAINFVSKDSAGFPDTKVTPTQIIKVHFRDIESIKDFSNLLKISGVTPETNCLYFCDSVASFSNSLNQTISNKTKSIWFPKYDREKPSNYLYTKGGYKLKYPVYIDQKVDGKKELLEKHLIN